MTCDGIRWSGVDDPIATHVFCVVKSEVAATFVVGLVRTFPHVHLPIAALKHAVIKRHLVATLVVLLVYASRPKRNRPVATHVVLTVEITAF